MIDKYLMPALGGALIWGLILLVFVFGAKVGTENQKESLYFKCVEMREMPLGACSRLFGSVSDNDQAKRESGEK